MSTLEIILAICQGAVLPVIGWALMSIIGNGNKIAALEARFDLYLELIGIKAVKSLHSPHTPEFDALLDKWLSAANGGDNMSEQELRQFVHKLELAELEKDDKFRSHQAAVLRAIVLSKYPNLRKDKP